MDLFLYLFLYSFSLILSVSGDDRQSYRESLLLKQLPDGKTLAVFEHVLNWRGDNPATGHDTINHYDIFPRPIAEIVTHYKVQELHLSLTRGKWKSSLWGYPPIESPPGAEFWVWFSPKTLDVAKEWTGLLHSISGMTCASLNAVHSSTTYQPTMSFKPVGALPNGYNVSSSYLRYTALPREPVCTENLTPWSKLLPCKQKAGLGSLYVALKLYDTVYHSLSLKVVPTCQDPLCSSVSTVLTQSLSVVFNHHHDTLNWSLLSLFSKKITSRCPLSSSSLIFVDLSSNLPNNGVVLSPPPTSKENVSEFGSDGQLAVYELEKILSSHHSSLDITLSWENNKHRQILPAGPPLNIRRYVTGSGHERGGLVTIITNTHSNTTLIASLLDMTPWFIRLLYHTLQLSCHQENINNNNNNNSDCMDKLVISHRYVPAKDRKLPYTIEYILSLPPQSSVQISIEFLRGFLKWNEHPPDASHGFFINSAVLTVAVKNCLNCTLTPSYLSELINNNSSRKQGYTLLRIHSEALLVSLPIPDFSMPYNVICFVSTVLAISFGSLFNLTTKKLGPVTDKDQKPNLIKRIINFIFKK